MTADPVRPGTEGLAVPPQMDKEHERRLEAPVVERGQLEIPQPAELTEKHIHEARRICRLEEMVRRAFPPSEFGDLAWPILIALAGAKAFERAVPVAPLAVDIGRPRTTTQRSLRILERGGLVEWSKNSSEGVILTEAGCKVLELLLTQFDQ